MVKQYCRYCANAIDYNGEATDFICEAEAPCGNMGAGAFYPATKAKRPNNCKYFIFNPNDLFRVDADGNFAQYKPRDAYVRHGDSPNMYEQIMIPNEEAEHE